MKRGVCDDHRYSRVVPDSPDMSPPSREFNEWREPTGLLLGALENAIRAADDALEDLSTPPLRREAVRTARRELKSVRAIAPLCRVNTRARSINAAVDGMLEFSAKANQLLGPLRDRDALARSIQRLADRFADAESRRVVRTVLLATLVFAEADRRDDSTFAAAAIDRARRAIRAARTALEAHTLHVNANNLPRSDSFDAMHALALLGRTFMTARRELAAALETGDLVRLHECRKKAAFIALALRPFDDSLPSAARRLRSRARTLASTLGEDRDWALLDVEMRAARQRLDGSPLVVAIDGALRLARIEAHARVEDSARAFLRLSRKRVANALAVAFE